MVHFISSEKSPVILRIVNGLGVVVFEKNYTNAATEFHEQISLQRLPEGNYFALVHQGNNTYKEAFMHQE